MLTCHDIGKYFIWLAHETGSFISNLKLQKLVYYSQAWHLAVYKEPLFEEDFEAWVHGPVIKKLYNKYKHYQWKLIEEEVEEPNFPEEVRDFLEEVAEVYFSYNAYDLERMTHLEDPWRSARGNLAQDAPSNEIITKESMKNYFEARVEKED